MGTLGAYALGAASLVSFMAGLMYTGYVAREIISIRNHGKRYGQLDIESQVEEKQALTRKEKLAYFGIWLVTPILVGLTVENIIEPLIGLIL